MKTILLGFGVPIFLTFAIVICIVWYQAAQKNSLIANGMSGTGIIQTLTQTSGRVGGMPVVKVMMQVTPAQGAPFQATASQVISPANAYAFAPGLQVPVKFDPNDHGKIVILTGGN